jgi:NNP family nitrate/nitrite transporter-like MFS transporter
MGKRTWSGGGAVRGDEDLCQIGKVKLSALEGRRASRQGSFIYIVSFLPAGRQGPCPKGLGLRGTCRSEVLDWRSVAILKKTIDHAEDLKKQEKVTPPFRSQVGPLIFLGSIFFLNLISRAALASLMPTIEAGSFFFIISLGYSIMLLASGFVTSWINHRRTVILSSITTGGSLLFVSINPNLWGIRFGFLLLGMAAGIYLPSGIAMITELVDPRHFGKAIAIHELAPNLSFLAAPLVSEALLWWVSWREVLLLIGMASIVLGILFIFFGKGGAFPGQAPNFGILKDILAERSFWIMVVLFTLGIGVGYGIYSMLPLYLVSEREMGRPWANTIIGLSRVPCLGAAILSGWMTDRLGPKRALTWIFLAAGFVTMLLGIIPGTWVILVVLFQAVPASAFFPPGFAVLSRIGPARVQKLAVSLTVPIGFVLGGGVVPAGIGFIGETQSFSLGFSILGALAFGGLVLIRYLRFN